VSDLARQANLLGALALVVTDRCSAAIGTATGVQTETAAAALSALYHFLDRPSIDLLRQVLGLTPSGTVRLVDRLADAGYVTRGQGQDGRSRSISLTDAGRQAAERVTEVRASVLGEALSRLSSEERTILEDLIGRILAGFVRSPGATRWICRLCDTGACGRDDGMCPVANAAAG
jgi:DNA-binding MarR family transcriptional regulator